MVPRRAEARRPARYRNGEAINAARHRLPRRQDGPGGEGSKLQLGGLGLVAQDGRPFVLPLAGRRRAANREPDFIVLNGLDGAAARLGSLLAQLIRLCDAGRQRLLARVLVLGRLLGASRLGEGDLDIFRGLGLDPRGRKDRGDGGVSRGTRGTPSDGLAQPRS
jgi:hypothetical protein